MKLLVRAALLAGVFTVGACSSKEHTPRTVEDGEGEALASSARHVGGVWLFTHSGEGGERALHGGTARVANDCLLVDDTVVIWHESHIDEVAGIVSAVQQGASYVVSVGGGGFNAEEDNLPASRLTVEIMERCRVSAVWYASSEDLRLEVKQ